MAVEFCAQCERESWQTHRTTGYVIEHGGSPTSGRRYYEADHYGKKCRYSMCREHCTCSSVQRKAWGDYLAWAKLNQGATVLTRPTHNGRVVARFRCGGCGRGSTHICTQHVANHSHTDGQGVGTARRCGKCCNQCSTQVTRYAIPCDERIQAIIVTCPGCDIHVPSTSCTVVEGRVVCFRCANTPMCVGCGVLGGTIANHVNSGNRRQLLICGRCNRCMYEQAAEGNVSCCACSTAARTANNVQRLTMHQCGIFKGHLDHAKFISANPVKRSLGVELEVAGFARPSTEALSKLYNTCVKWHAAIGTDGSLRSNHNNSVEIRTSPAFGQKFLIQLHDILHHIRKANGYVNDSCGLHVHVGLQDISTARTRSDVLAQYGKIIGVWDSIEKTVYSLVDGMRYTSQYASGWHTQGGYTSLRNRYDFHTTLPQDIYTNFYGRMSRYSGLNLEAIAKYSTVEFRLHHGSLESDVVVPWSLLCGQIVLSALTTNHLGDLLKFIAEISPERFLLEIAPNAKVREYLEKRLIIPPLPTRVKRTAKKISVRRRAA